MGTMGPALGYAIAGTQHDILYRLYIILTNWNTIPNDYPIFCIY
jgi:hypothetical protein